MATQDELDDEFSKAFDDEGAQALGRVNIAIYGATGAGKSSLINAIFGAEVASTGVGEPVTATTALYVNETGTLGIYDGAGFELGAVTPVREIVRRIRRDRSPGKGASDLIHVAWFCVNSATARLEAGQVESIKRIAAEGIPVILVLTKCSVRDGLLDPAVARLADAIAAMSLPVVGGRAVPTAAIEDAFNGTGKYGLEALLETTYRVVPEAQRVAIAAAQKIDLTIKARYARSWIAGAVAFAGGVGFAPVPLADAAVLVPAQAALMAKIAAIYDIPKARAAQLIAAATSSAAAGGKLAAASIIGLVPGVGQVINAAVAGTVTGAIGESWRAMSERIFTGSLPLEKTEEVNDLVTHFLGSLRGWKGDKETESAE